MTQHSPPLNMKPPVCISPEVPQSTPLHINKSVKKIDSHAIQSLARQTSERRKQREKERGSPTAGIARRLKWMQKTWNYSMLDLSRVSEPLFPFLEQCVKAKVVPLHFFPPLLVLVLGYTDN